MLTRKQHELFSLFAEDVFNEYSFTELKERSGERSHSLLQRALRRFQDEGLVAERAVGPTKLYSLNLDSEAVNAYLALYANDRIKKISPVLSLLQQEIEKVTLFYSLVVFGSYAEGTQRAGSDVDVAVILQDKVHKVKAAVNRVRDRSLIGLDAHVITSGDFLAMLLADYENLGKEIARKNLPVVNNSIFYKLVRKGRSHGFTG